MYLSMEVEINRELEAKEKRNIIYRPLPRKSISTYKSGRPCKVKHYTREEIENYASENDLSTNRGCPTSA